MFWNVWIGLFAAVGALFFLWLLRGLFLPAAEAKEVAVYCAAGGEISLLRRYRWMRELGLSRCRLCLVGSKLSDEIQKQIREEMPGVRFCTPEQWLEDMKERLEADG